MRQIPFQRTLLQRMPVVTVVAALLVPVTLQAQAQQATTGQRSLPPAEEVVGALPDIVARIDGHPITKNQLLRQADSMRLQAIQSGTQDPAQEGKDFLVLVADALIGEYLVYRDGKSRGIVASDAEVEEEVRKLAAAYPDEATFDQALRARGLDREALREETRQQLSIDKLFQEEIEPAVQLTEEALRAYYDANSSKFLHPPKVRARHILKQIPEGENGDVQRIALNEARRQIVDESKEFGELAVARSDDTKTRDLGGDMGWIRITGRRDGIGQLLSQLETGEVSEVVQTQLGLHIFQVMEKQAPQPVSFEEARDAIAQRLVALRAREQIQRRVVELREKAEVEILM